jgi:hypothetical protein
MSSSQPAIFEGRQMKVEQRQVRFQPVMARAGFGFEAVMDGWRDRRSWHH